MLLTDITTKIFSMPTENFFATLNHHQSILNKYFADFRFFIQKMARKDDTWRFWVQFVFEDAMAYVSPFMAIRSGNWDLRLASI